jgi:tRNA_anti-like
MAKKTKYGTYLFLFLVIAIAVYSYFLHAPGWSSAKLVNPDFRLTAHEWVGIFDSNELQSDQHYMNKIISVSGVVRMTRQNEWGTYTISLGSLSGQPTSVNCALDTAYVHHPVQLKKGDSVTIRGRYVGQAHDLTLVQCIIEK